jgi:hypothetical protein
VTRSISSLSTSKLGQPIESRVGAHAQTHKKVIMIPRHYHNPAKPISTRARCPVCNETVYSRAGIHPQCAAIESDPRRLRGKQKGAVPMVAVSAALAETVPVDVVADPLIAQATPASERPLLLELSGIT